MKKDLERLKSLDKVLAKRIIGQAEAVTSVAQAIRRSRVGVASYNRPIASFLFLGPTGVGKTELVKALADEVYNDKEALIKIDMSEFMERHNTSRLVGATAGYVGYEEGGQLTEAVRRKPYSIVLFDEIEKAHRDVFNLLLQIMEDGQLTDAKGRKIDFSNTIIIMTSNIGADKLTQTAAPIGFSLTETEKDRAQKDFERAKEDIMADLKKAMKPEFLNRIDKVIVFDALTHDHIKEIVRLLVVQLEERLSEVNIKIVISDAALSLLAEKGYDPEYGARPARRVIRDQIEDEITQLLVDGAIVSGATVAVDVNEGKIVVNEQKL